MSPANTTYVCPFCSRVSNGEYLREWFIDEHRVVAFEPLNPVTRWHMLFIPATHVPDATTDPALSAAVMAAVSLWAKHEREHANIITSIGSLATQTVPHLHLHYVPRTDGDGLHLPWTGQVTAPLGTAS